MKGWLGAGAILFVCCSCISTAGDQLSIAVMGSYTTNTRFIYDVGLPDESINDRYFYYNFGFGADLRWLAHSDDILVGINVEKIKTVEQNTERITSGGLQYLIPTEDGFVVYPVELSGYFVIPVSTDDVRAYLGGGLGWYFGERLSSVAGVRAATLNAPLGFGIHVLTGADIRIRSGLAVRAELKFRDPQFYSVNKFDQSSATFGGIRFLLDQTPTKTLVNLNGITYRLGLVFTL